MRDACYAAVRWCNFSFHSQQMKFIYRWLIHTQFSWEKCIANSQQNVMPKLIDRLLLTRELHCIMLAALEALYGPFYSRNPQSSVKSSQRGIVVRLFRQENDVVTSSFILLTSSADMQTWMNPSVSSLSTSSFHLPRRPAVRWGMHVNRHCASRVAWVAFAVRTALHIDPLNNVTVCCA